MSFLAALEGNLDDKLEGRRSNDGDLRGTD
jgi:hypothetical protein